MSEHQTTTVLSGGAKWSHHRLSKNIGRTLTVGPGLWATLSSPHLSYGSLGKNFCFIFISFY